MRRWLAVVAAWAGRAVHGLWPDRNPLRRNLDRMEALIFAGLAVAFLAGAPLAAVTAGHVAFSAASRTVHTQQSWRQVPAVLLETAPQSAAPTARARWTAPDGTRRSGTVSTPPGAKAGTTVRVWVDPAGRPTGPPFAGSPMAEAVLAAVIAPMALGSVLLCAGAAAHGVLGRRRLAAWDADWEVTEPQWTRRG